MFEASTASPAETPAERVFPDTGIRLGGPFLAFYEHYGPTLCGPPLTERLDEAGVPTQYFRHLALQEPTPGRVALKPLGAAWLAEHAPGDPEPGGLEGSAVERIDLRGRLPAHPERVYPRRPLVDIRYLVVHHSGASPSFGPEAIAAQHVEGNGWPGIAYHYVIDPAGRVFQTQDLTVLTHHAAQFNPVAAGIALAGDLSTALPPEPQRLAAARLLAELCLDLGLAPDAVRGHGELVGTGCPGARFLGEWKPRLLSDIERHLRTQPAGQIGAGAA